MSLKRNRRLLNEWRKLQKSQPEGIWVEQVDDSIDHFQAMVMAPPGPCEGGFFLFDITCPSDYPNQPPKARFLNTRSGVRIHPNLYGDGKICLSILGTWGGPSWSCIMGIETVLLNIQSLVGMDHPIQGEPSHETDIAEGYTKYVSQACLEQFIYEPLFGKTKKMFPERFQHIMKDIFLQNRERYLAFHQRCKSIGISTQSGRPYCVSIQPDFDKIGAALATTYVGEVPSSSSSAGAEKSEENKSSSSEASSSSSSTGTPSKSKVV